MEPHLIVYGCGDCQNCNIAVTIVANRNLELCLMLFFSTVLQEMDETERKLRAELENMKLRTSVDVNQSWRSDGWEEESKMNPKAEPDADADTLKSAMLEKLEKKKKDLVHCIFKHKILYIFFAMKYCLILNYCRHINIPYFLSEFNGGYCTRVGEEMG